jgi:hypothetical protein
VRIESVDYEDGRVYLTASGQQLEYPYEPAILIPPHVYPLISTEGISRIIKHEHSVELRAPLYVLLDVQREVSAFTSAFLFLPPERQFLIDKKMSIGSELNDGMASFSLPSFSSARDALAFLLRSKHGLPPRVFVENVLYEN